METVNVSKKNGVMATFFSFFTNNIEDSEVENSKQFKELKKVEKELGATNHIKELTDNIEKINTIDKTAGRTSIDETEKTEINHKKVAYKSKAKEQDEIIKEQMVKEEKTRED